MRLLEKEGHVRNKDVYDYAEACQRTLQLRPARTLPEALYEKEMKICCSLLGPTKPLRDKHVSLVHGLQPAQVGKLRELLFRG